jgi:hypothetical protein
MLSSSLYLAGDKRCLGCSARAYLIACLVPSVSAGAAAGTGVAEAAQP